MNNKWASKNCKVNGINIHYLRTGGNKPSVVLLHGLMTNGSCWTNLAQGLENDYDVIMPDARGHGNSSAPDNGYSYNNLASDVLNLIDILKLDKPMLIGHSMGGMTAALVANKRCIRGLVLADPTFLTPERQREVYESDVAAQHSRILNQPKDDYLAEIRIRHKHRSRELIELFAEARFQTSMNAFKILTPPNPDYIHLIKALNTPSLLVIGDVGSVVPLEMASDLASLNRHLKFIQIEEAGHGVPYDQPERFCATVKAFLSTLFP
jgi:pimeloyl-ACP methyl ester carboxylesterase